MIQAYNLKFSYNRDTSFSYPDIIVGKQAPLLITGNSGTGKTTLLHLLGCLLKPQEGKIQINDTDTSLLSSRHLDRFRGKHIGIVFQSPHFMSALSVLDNILLPQYFNHALMDHDKAISISNRLGITHLLQKSPLTLSKGEQQRVTIARALMNSPELLLADEPTSSLDDANTAHVIQLLQEQANISNAMLIVVTHDARVKQHFSNHIHLQG